MSALLSAEAPLIYPFHKRLVEPTIYSGITRIQLGYTLAKFSGVQEMLQVKSI